MFGKKRKDTKIAEAGGLTATATVVSSRRGVPGTAFFESDDSDTNTRVYTLQVEPEGGPAFEAKVKVREDEMMLDDGASTFVIYDPADPTKIAFDMSKIGLAGLAEFKQGLGSEQQSEHLQKLAAAHARGILSDADYEKAKAAFLNS